MSSTQSRNFSNADSLNLLNSNASTKGRINTINKKSFMQKQKFSVQQDQNNDQETLRQNIMQEASEKYLQEEDDSFGFSPADVIGEFEKEGEGNFGSHKRNSEKKEKKAEKFDKQKVQNDVNENKKTLYAAYGMSQNNSKRNRTTICKQSDANKILEQNWEQKQKSQVDSDQQKQKQGHSSTPYHHSYTTFLSQKGNDPSSHSKSIPSSSKQSPTPNSDHELFLQELQTIIFTEVNTMQLKELKGNFVLEHVTDDLEAEMDSYETRIRNERLTTEELLKVRMHMQAIAKLMVFVHGKSEYRLVISHYYIGEAYRMNKCYEQAIDHFTIALKKNTKLTEIKQTKIYHSFILTSLSECYFELEMYADSLEILLRAYEIQQCYVNSELKINNIKTIRLISECYLKMKNYRQAIDYMEKICLIVERLKGSNCREYAEIKFQKAVIVGEERNLLGAIEEVKAAIELVQTITTIEPFQKQMIILEYSKKLAEFLEKFGDIESQLQCLKHMLKIIDSQKAQGFIKKNMFVRHIIAIKKKIIVISVKHCDFQIAISELEETLEEENYGSDSPRVSQTLKMLGLVHLYMGNDKHAEEYFKKCYKLDQQGKDNRADIKEIERIFKSFGYGKRVSLKNKSFLKS